MQIKPLPISKLTPYANNARTHSPEQIEQIARSIEEFGFNNPVLIDGKKGIVAGHGRVLAAESLGLDKVPTIELKHLSAAQKRAYIIADNKLALNAGWSLETLKAELGELKALDFDISLTGFNDTELSGLLDSNPGLTDPDDIPEVPDPITKPGDVWVLGRHRLVCGDSTKAEDVGKCLDGQKVQCVFTSPPYGVGLEYGEYKDSIQNLREMLPKLSRIWAESVVPGGYAVVNFGDIVSANEIVGTIEPCEYPMALEYWPVFRADGWVLWSRRAWCKPCAGTGSMQCISSNRAATNWENVWTWKRPGKALHNKQISGNFASQNGWIDSTNTHKVEIGKSKHGAGMPTYVAEFMISVHSFHNGCVLEPFAGTGTTIIAAEMTGRVCHAIELEPAYVDICVKRWENFTGNKAKRVKSNGSLG